MISSEVQRTLVKSPPELWAELSDPGALARHLGELGELGEIRITRVEPEQLVEWEAENRTGTVHIKPSGWGTRVTLTVSTELHEATASAPAGEHAPAAAAQDDPSPPREERAAAAEDESTAVAEEEPAAVAEDGPAAVAEDEPALAAEDEPTAVAESIPSPLGVPLTAAAASSWRAGVEREHAEDPSLGWIAENGPELQAATPADEEPGEAYEWAPYEEPEPRRGFFARLFGRRRRRAALDAESAEDALEAISAAEALRGPEPEAAAGQATAESTDSPFADREIVVPDADARMDAESATAATFEAATADDASADELEPVHEEPVEPIAEVSAAEPEAPSPWPDRCEQGDDIAAELKAAEETADAEVTAVLTSVLDRLGAAHHRPFSRS